MVRKTIAILMLISCFILIFQPSIGYSEKNLVFDEANLLTNSEILLLEEEANRISDKYNMDIVIVTTNDAQGKSSRDFADDYFDYGGFGRGSEYDGILFLLDMDNREAYISTTGIGIRYLTDQRIESVLDSVFDGGLSSGNYYGAILGFLDRTEFFLEQGIPSGQYNQPEPEPNTLTFEEVIFSLIGGIIAGGLFYIINKSRYKMGRRHNPYSYRANSIVNFTARDDKLINTFVTHRVIPKNNNISGGSSSGRSTTHRSSSGRSHGGGGRKF